MIIESAVASTSTADDPMRYLPLPSPGSSSQYPPTVPHTPDPPLTPLRQMSYSPSETSLTGSKQSFLTPFSSPNKPSIGIIETPHRGRRLTLFQETSEESFEESLMAGGYGRYRTAEWVRQPQPLVLGQSGAPVMALLEEQQQQPPVEEPPPPPPTEKELKKRKRMAAFRTDHTGFSSVSKLYPVELEGKGRVLLDVPHDATFPEISPSRRGRGASNAPSTRRSRKKAETPPKETEDVTLPNWPDSEFPWRLRKEERSDQVKAEETERLKIIENFFDRDSDEEDEGEPGDGPIPEEEVIPSARWGMVYEDDTDQPMPSRRGRGKMVPLRGDPSHPSANASRKRKAYFPSDPADARAALLSKRSVRALSYRQQHRPRGNRRTAQETVCICRGTDDGRELVQCDECKQWYHLECIGIQDASELGREEDPWFCHDCIPDISSTESIVEDTMATIREPTFVPTDETPSKFKRFDLDGADLDSPAPNWPKTPTREPVTPRHVDVRIYSTPGLQDGFRMASHDYDDFDPTSTPSRGITFNAPFTTPKNNVFTRAGPVTPSRPRGSKSFGGTGFLNAMLDSSSSPSLQESPFRTPQQPRRILDPSRPSIPRFEIPSSPLATTDV